jgi:hypothetical protein
VYARIVTGQVSPVDIDRCLRLWNETVAPSVRTQRGFGGARVFVQRESGRILSLGLWESGDDFNNTVSWNDEQLATFQALFTAQPVVELFELGAEATPA